MVKNMKKSLLCIWISAILVLNTSIKSVRTQTTTVSVDPILYTVEAVGVTFKINITLTEVTNLAGYEFKLAYNPAILNATLLEYGGIFGDTYFPLISVINNTAGWLGFAAMEMWGEPEFNGSGILAIITFNATALGSIILDLYDTILADALGQPIAHIAIGGGSHSRFGIPSFPGVAAIPAPNPSNGHNHKDSMDKKTQGPPQCPMKQNHNKPKHQKTVIKNLITPLSFLPPMLALYILAPNSFRFARATFSKRTIQG